MQEDKKYEWRKRSPEWIKENPKKGTMYKHYFDEALNKEDTKPEPPKIQEFGPVKRTEKQEKIRYSKVFKKVLPPKGTNDAGIYAIICEASKSAYIGQSINVGVRLRNHKMYIISGKSNEKHYKKIRTDVDFYGIQSLEFKKHIALPMADVETLLTHEKQAMQEFMNNGYTLYNTVTYGNLYCPETIIKTISKLISKIDTNPNLIEQIKALID